MNKKQGSDGKKAKLIQSVAKNSYSKIRAWLVAPRDLITGFIFLGVVGEVIGLLGLLPVQLLVLAVASFICLQLAIFGKKFDTLVGITFAAVFFSRLATLSIPAIHISLATRTAISGAIMVYIAIVAIRVLRIDIRILGPSRKLTNPPLIINKVATTIATISIGPTIGALAYLALSPDSQPIKPGFFGYELSIAALMGGLFLSALGEELIYRRLVSAMTHRVLGKSSPFLTATIYAVAFIPTGKVAMVFIAFIAGAAWTTLSDRIGNVWPAVISHFIASVTTYVLISGLWLIK